ncbi:nitrite reductase small subunit NirD [Pseudonocardia sp. RS010]|uniref:nitrite reductase small subunit NirD n=1 Tax=Pseudonocardia sp. RS010 TaxID=3385979 RepID=UPI0039A179BE
MTTTDERPATERALRWETACPLERLQPERGVAALFGEEQVAIFRTHDGRLYALGNVDPKSGAAVLSRGIVGDRRGEPVVASPVYKESFSLVDGRCLDAAGVCVPVYAVRVHDGLVQIGLR